MSKQKLNFAFIGCGGNARGHGRSVSGVKDVEIIALADPECKLTRCVQRKRRFRRFSPYLHGPHRNVSHCQT